MRTHWHLYNTNYLTLTVLALQYGHFCLWWNTKQYSTLYSKRKYRSTVYRYGNTRNRRMAALESSGPNVGSCFFASSTHLLKQVAATTPHNHGGKPIVTLIALTAVNKGTTQTITHYTNTVQNSCDRCAIFGSPYPPFFGRPIGIQPILSKGHTEIRNRAHPGNPVDGKPSAGACEAVEERTNPVPQRPTSQTVASLGHCQGWIWSTGKA